MSENNEAARCDFCGNNRNIAKRIKPGLMAQITQTLPTPADGLGHGIQLVITVPPPKICYDCVLRFADEIRAAENADVDLLLEDGAKRITFKEGRWYTYDNGDFSSKEEIYRSEALTILTNNGLKQKITKEAWQDVIKSNEPLAATNEKAEE